MRHLARIAECYIAGQWVAVTDRFLESLIQGVPKAPAACCAPDSGERTP